MRGGLVTVGGHVEAAMPPVGFKGKAPGRGVKASEAKAI